MMHHLFFLSGRRSLFRIAGILSIAVVCIAIFLLVRPARRLPLHASIRELLGRKSETTPVHARGRHLSLMKIIPEHYVKHHFTPVWLNENGRLQPYTLRLISRFRESYLEGLDPRNYHLAEIDSLASVMKKSLFHTDYASCARLEVILTDAYLLYTMDQYAGQVSSGLFNPERTKRLAGINPLDSLESIRKGADPDKVLDAFACPHAPYKQLRQLLGTCYHTDSLNAPGIEQRKQLLILNMERWRWLPREFPERYIMANIAGFYLQAFTGDSVALAMKVITGKQEQPTPLFEAKMTYIVINPWWEIPRGIAEKEMLPEIKKDKTYLEKNHIRVFLPGYPQEEADSDSINWRALSRNNFPYQLRQSPGVWNALGVIKFIFPNPYDVYFHDTPHPQLFSEKIRTYSHGCIRVERPYELAAYVTGTDTAQVRIKQREGETLTIPLSKPVAVYICYWTCWTDPAGRLNAAPDVYAYDEKLKKLLAARTQNAASNIMIP